MKMALVAAILGLAALAPTVRGQGYIYLYNYGYAGTEVTYSNGSPITSGYTVGFYWALSSTQSAAAQNAAMAGDYGQGQIIGLTLSSATAPIGSPDNPPGFFLLNTSVPLVGADNQTVTIVLVAYNGASYNSTTVRGHSAAFEMTANALPNGPLAVGQFMSSFIGAVPIPEPSTFALAGLGLAGLLFFHRKHP